MQDRRCFLKTGALAMAALSTPALPGCASCQTISAKHPLGTTKVKKALVAWYSQTGYTQRSGRLLAKTMEKAGIQVTSGDLRELDKNSVGDYQLIVVGSPVFYYDTPDYVKGWLASLPQIKGVAVASYVTFGGPEGNQHNAACSILEGLAERGGSPVAMAAFMNLGTYPPSWSGGKIKEHTWRCRNLPDAATYQRVRDFAVDLMAKVAQGRTAEFSKRLTMRELTTWFAPIWWTKLSIDDHHIKRDKCQQCGTCVDKCPVGAIDLDNYKVNTEACVLCFGCLNNCPTQAMTMKSGGERLIGYVEFMKTHHLKVTDPRELKSARLGDPAGPSQPGLEVRT